ATLPLSTASAATATGPGMSYAASTDGVVSVTVGAVLPCGPHAATALATFRRPPVVVLPDSDAIGSTLFSSTVLSDAVFVCEQRDRTSAAAPDTCGVAIEVPLRKRYVSPGNVESTCTPGAPRWTEFAP